MTTANITTLFCCLLLLLLYQIEPRYFRAAIRRRTQLITFHMGEVSLYQVSDFYHMTHFTISIFKSKLVDPIRHILLKTERRIIAYLYDDR